MDEKFKDCENCKRLYDAWRAQTDTLNALANEVLNDGKMMYSIAAGVLGAEILPPPDSDEPSWVLKTMAEGMINLMDPVKNVLSANLKMEDKNYFITVQKKEGKSLKELLDEKEEELQRVKKELKETYRTLEFMTK